MITLVPLEDKFIIYQVADYKEIPSEIFESGFYSLTKTNEEISIITNCTVSSGDIKSSKGWRGFRVEGIVDFSLIGIINEITAPLKDNKITVFVISTFNTDYIFVKEESFLKAIEIFRMSDCIKVKE
ncbi:MAG TPA: ACT domain-containing protein [Bacteroidales bacterium]|nr:ACT domain-containing protein [Bacteroidales bacterium]